MKKKILSIALTAALTASMATVAAVSASAAIDANGRYVPSEGITDTNRLYFYMPQDWYYDEYKATSAGCYWWSGSDSGEEFGTESGGVKWPGYMAQVSPEEGVKDLYYIDLPSDVETIVWNNYLDGGTREIVDGAPVYQYDEARYVAAKQTINVVSSYYSAGDNGHYDALLDGTFFDKAEEAVNGDDKSFLGDFEENFFIETEEGFGISMNFKNMIFIIDPSKTVENPLNGKLTYSGEWYFYYGDGQYGELPNKDMATEMGLVHSIKDYKPADPSTPTVKPNQPAGNNSQKPTAAPSKDAVSSTSDTAKNNSNTNGAIQTGDASMATMILLIVAGAAGVAVFARKRIFG